MYKNVLENIPGIEYYPIVALVLFFTFFVGLVVWFVKADKGRLAEIANQPLDEGVPSPNLHSSQSTLRS